MIRVETAIKDKFDVLVDDLKQTERTLLYSGISEPTCFSLKSLVFTCLNYDFCFMFRSIASAYATKADLI